MAENKTKPTDASVEVYILSRASEQQRTDCHELMALLKKVTQHSPKMWGPGHQASSAMARTATPTRADSGLAIRGRQLVVYLVAEGDRQKFLFVQAWQAQYIGKSRLFFKKPADRADRDSTVLEQLVAGSVSEVRQRYG